MSDIASRITKLESLKSLVHNYDLTPQLSFIFDHNNLTCMHIHKGKGCIAACINTGMRSLKVAI